MSAETIKRKIRNRDVAPSVDPGEQIIAYLNQLYENAQNPTVTQDATVSMCANEIMHYMLKRVDEAYYEGREDGIEIASND